MIEVYVECQVCGRGFWVRQPEPPPFGYPVPEHRLDGELYPCLGSRQEVAPSDMREAGLL
jgi:hypothetical protein